jgi:DNA-directed RNA polymerase subunit RPC12/RpoP
MRLIDADALEKFLKRLRRELPKESRDFFTRDEMILNFQQYVHMQPTIDAVPVVRGEWIEHEDEMECPQCGYFWNYCDNDTERFNYCPNCGAKMEDKPCG